MRKVLRFFGVALAAVICAALLPAMVLAASDTDGIAQSYNTDQTVRQGMIVGLKQGDSTKVVPLRSDDITDMLGVAISASAAPITLSGTATAGQVYVATTGQYNVLVSDQNGPVHAGDYISISALNGIGMKAQDDQSVVLGRAVADLSTAANGASTAVVTGSTGKRTVTIAPLPVTIAITGNPNHGHGSGDLPGFLQVASSSIANKPVAAPRVYMGIAVLLLTACIAGSLLYSGVRNSMVSIGRNPLARRSIVRGLMQVILVSITIFVIGLFGVYLLLRL